MRCARLNGLNGLMRFARLVRLRRVRAVQTIQTDVCASNIQTRSMRLKPFKQAQPLKPLVYLLNFCPLWELN